MRAATQILLATSLACVAAAAADSPIVGTWHGKLFGQPAVTLTLRDAGGNLSGSIVFYLLRNDGSGFKADANSARPPTELVNPKFDGKTLTFEVSHRQAHPPSTLNDTEPVKFEMELTGKDEAQLKRLNYGHDKPLIMRRGR